MRKVEDLTGRTFGRLTVLMRAENKPREGSRWLCICDCPLGTQLTVVRHSLTRADQPTRSCGCLNSETGSISGRASRTHGRSHTPEYNSWSGMIQRCTNPSCNEYERYGGRGIKVCDEWLNSFGSFFAHVGLRPTPNHSLDRIRVNENYEPGNVRWATNVEQCNNKRTNRKITAFGLTMNLVEWSRMTGINRTTLATRLKAGLSPEQALFGVTCYE